MTNASNDWSVIHRPTTLEKFIAPRHVIDYAQTLMNKPPSSILIEGAFGNGKTTLARIIAQGMTNAPGDIEELNAAEAGSIENIRALIRTAAFRPKDKRRVLIIDEAHGLSAAAATALLKPVEEPPGRVTWIFCSSESGKLNRALLTRARRFTLPEPETAQIREALADILNAEKVGKYSALAKLEKSERKSIMASMCVVAARAGAFRTAVKDLQMLASIVEGMKPTKAEKIAEALKQASASMERFADVRGKDLIKLVMDDKIAAVGVLLRARDASTFNDVYYAARDMLSRGTKSRHAAQLFRWCIEALEWSQLSRLDPGNYLAMKLASTVMEKN